MACHFVAVRFGFLGGIAVPLAAIGLYRVANPKLLAFHAVLLA